MAKPQTVVSVHCLCSTPESVTSKLAYLLTKWDPNFSWCPRWLPSWYVSIQGKEHDAFFYIPASGFFDVSVLMISWQSYSDIIPLSGGKTSTLEFKGTHKHKPQYLLTCLCPKHFRNIGIHIIWVVRVPVCSAVSYTYKYEEMESRGRRFSF